MDLISRKSLLEKTHMADVLHAIKGITKSVEVVLADDVEVAPSAFEGMTVGEVLETIFPKIPFELHSGFYSNGRIRIDYNTWNSPYREVSK